MKIELTWEELEEVSRQIQKFYRERSQYILEAARSHVGDERGLTMRLASSLRDWDCAHLTPTVADILAEVAKHEKH